MIHLRSQFCRTLNAMLWLLSASVLSAQAQGVFTLRLGTTPAAPTPLLRHDDFWHYHKGTNAPQADWKLTDDDLLNTAEWSSGRGGFGYGDGDDTTILSDMSGRYSTVYIRKSLVVSAAFAADDRLRLVMDFDDAFIAWLDGTEIARSSNAPGAQGTEPANTAFATSGRNASGDTNGTPTPAITYDLGVANSVLEDGTHVLSLMGFNDNLTSSDLSLIADLSITHSGSGSILQGTYFALVQTNQILLSGTNTLPNSTRVTVNGANAAYNPVDGSWSRTQPLNPGMNRFFIAAHDATGNILGSTNRDIIYEASTTTVGGTLSGNTSWTSGMGTIRVTSDVVVPSGVTLSVGNGVVVLLSPGVSIRATAGGTIDVAGTETNPDFFLPADANSNWGAINATGSGASITARHIETAAGAITFNSQANGLIEDSYLHDRSSILTANSAGTITTRRIHVRNYSETIYNSGTIAIAEDSLYEDLRTSDADSLEIQGGPPGSIVHRCTFRNSLGSNSDAVDFNGTSGARVESCLIHNITDKGISLGASGQGGSPDFGITISNCLIYHVDTGIAVKDGSTATLYDTTISDSAFGMRLYQKFSTPIGGGHVTNGYNNIIWGNTTSLDLLNGATVDVDYSDVQGTNAPGTGNIDANPLFVNAAAGDYRLQPASPCIDTGRNESTMGAKSPVGGIPSAPRNLAVLMNGTNPLQLTWQDDAENETAFLIERSTNAVNWESLASTAPNQTTYTDSSANLGKTYFYRVRAQNPSGLSRFSNVGSGIREIPTTFVGGTLNANTTWTSAMGNIIVRSNIIVPTNITLTIQAGSHIKLTNNVAITAQAGGAIHIDGTAANRVVLERWNGTNNWNEIRADGTNASLTIRFADISGGQTTVYNGARGLLEDSFFHDFIQQGAGTIFNQPIILTHFSAGCNVRRCVVRNYHETLWRHGVNIIEDSLFEDMVGDALDFDAAVPGSTVRRCTFRHGNRTNVDAVDIGNDGNSRSAGVRIESCLMYDFPLDKGVSIGEISLDTVVTNCLMYNCLWGIGVKDSCTAGLYNNTITTCEVGFRLYHKTDPGSGIVTNSFNNILWGNTNAILVLDGGTIEASYNDVEGGIWPGAGNISSDPLFVNTAQRDYRLQPASPCIDTGRDETTMGAHFPVGAVIAPSHPYFTQAKVENGEVVLRFWADNEKTYTIQKSASVSGGWIKVTNVGSPPIPTLTEIRETVVQGETRFYRLVTPALP
jgi:hypothetical protein